MMKIESLHGNVTALGGVTIREDGASATMNTLKPQFT